MQALSYLLREVRRRKVLSAFGIFVGGGWAVLQVLDLFIERGLLPEWTFTGGLLALTVGLPVVLATAFVQGGTRSDPSRDETPEAHIPGSGLQSAETQNAADGSADAGSADARSEAELDLARLLTWRRATVGGVLAFALLGVASGGFMIMRVMGIGSPGTLAAQGAFEVGGRVVVADFESSAGASAPGDLITEALRIDLEQSVAFDVVDKAEVVATQRLMLMDPAAPLNEDVAREVSQRLGVAGVISGEIGRVGASFVLTSRLIEAESGAVLASFRQTAPDSTALIEAIDALASGMRAKVGESLRSVRAAESLREVTTTSLEALKKYTYVSSRLYRSTMDATIARQMLEEAVALDSTFATANLALAIAINNYGGSPERGWQATSAAYRHRGRLSEGERYAVEAYYFMVAGDQSAAIQAYRGMLQVDPTNTAAATNIADILMYSGDYDGAVSILRATPDYTTQPWAWNLMTSLAALGRLDEALAVRDTFELENPGTFDNFWGRALLLTTSGHLDEAREVLNASPPPPPGAGVWATLVSANTDALGGRVASFREQLDGAIMLGETYGTVPQQIVVGLYGPWVTAWVERDSAGVGRDVDALLSGIDYASASPLDRWYPEQALLFAMVGDRDRVEGLLLRYSSEVDTEFDPFGRARADVARALLASRSGDDVAVAALEQAVGRMRCNRCGDVLLGHGYETAGRSTRAIEAYERYLAHPFFDGSDVLMQLFSSNVHERLGMLYEEMGDDDRAAQHYAAFADLWKDPDPVFRDRVARARARANATGGG